MKLKLDENLGLRGRDILSAPGRDVATVASQSLEKALDAKLIYGLSKPAESASFKKSAARKERFGRSAG